MFDVCACAFTIVLSHLSSHEVTQPPFWKEAIMAISKNIDLSMNNKLRIFIHKDYVGQEYLATGLSSPQTLRSAQQGVMRIMSHHAESDVRLFRCQVSSAENFYIHPHS